MTRRQFMQRSLGAGAILASGGTILTPAVRAMEPIRRKGSGPLRVSLAAYSFRDSFTHPDLAKRITMFDFLDYCADHGCHGAEVTSYYFPKEINPAYFIELKRRAFLRGLEISGTAVGNNFAFPPGAERDRQIASVKQWIDYAYMMGAPHIRVFAGDPKGIGKAEAKNLCIGALEECCAYAGAKGIWLGLENHGGIVATIPDLLDIVQGVKSPWCGVNLDTGNFFTDADPYEEMALLAPYAVNVQLKVEVSRRGKPRETTDLARVMKILRAANYQGYVALEYEAKSPEKEVPEWLRKMRAAFALEKAV